MKAALSIAFSLVAGSALAHPSFVAHAHPHDWSMLPGADAIALAAIAFGLSTIVLAYLKRGES